MRYAHSTYPSENDEEAAVVSHSSALRLLGLLVASFQGISRRVLPPQSPGRLRW